jgi:hypothetical protein
MSIVNITFDSNVFPKVVNPNPDKFPDEQALPSFQIINSSIKNGYAKGFLAETDINFLETIIYPIQLQNILRETLEELD